MATPVKVSHVGTKGFWEIPVLYEDESLLALDKPANLDTLPEHAGAEAPALLPLLHAAIRDHKPWATERALTYLRPAHELDFGASGVLLFAKTPPLSAALSNAFGSEQVTRRYLVLVHGRPDQEHFDVDAKLAPHPEHPGLMRVDSRQGKKSRTTFEILEKYCDWTLLAGVPHPDRLSQIRAHLGYKRLAVAGDAMFPGGVLRLSSIKPGFRLKPKQVERPLVTRPALHLESITLRHPVTGVTVLISAPLAKDFSVALKYLRKYASSINQG